MKSETAFYTPGDEVANVFRVFKSRVIATSSAVAMLLFVVGSGAVSGNSSVPSTSTSTTTTVVEQFDDESGLIWSQIDDHTIEISLPD